MEDTAVCFNDRISRYTTHAPGHSTSAMVMTGRLITPMAGGLGYRTATQCSVTNSVGEFRYLTGERVTFFLGKIPLPMAKAGSTVTPYDMGATPNEAINVSRLLHTLARRGGASLQFPAKVTHWTSGAVDFAADPISFAQQPVVAGIMTYLGCQLLDTATSIEYLDTMLARYIKDWHLA